MLDWARSQAALTRAGYPCGKIDGVDLEKTWTALFAFAAGRPADATTTALGKAAVAWLRADPIAQTPARLAEFLAQCAHETGGFTCFEEQLNHSAANMLDLWPTHFTAAQARAAVGHPVLIASRAYGGRNGNAPYPSQDGYTYRGRGMLQLTGRANYAAYGAALNLPLIDKPDLAADPADSLVIAREFWSRGRVNACCDRGDFTAARAITNGGRVGLADVAKRRAALRRVLA